MRLKRVSTLIILLSSLSSAQNAKLDMLDWLTMDPFGSHMSGSGTPMWTVMDAARSKFYWVKSAKGYPWDVKSYDSKFIYDTTTEVSWSDPQTFKRHIGLNGKGYPISPRFVPYVPGGAPLPVASLFNVWQWRLYFLCTLTTRCKLHGPFFFKKS